MRPFLQRCLAFLCDKSVLAALFVFVILTNLHFFTEPYIPLNDTLERFNYYYFFYNEFFFRGALAQWMPNHAFGLPAGYAQLFALTPASYLSFVAGKAASVQDVFLLFKTSMLFEQFALMLGIYLLAKELFRRKSTVLMVCIGALSCSLWQDQIDFQFRAYYLLPMMLFCLVRFHAGKDPRYFLLAVIHFLASAMGVALYIPVVTLLVLAVVNAGLSCAMRTPWSCYWTLRRSHVPYLALIVALASAVFYQLAHFHGFVNILSRAADGQNSLNTFLTYGDFQGSLRLIFEYFLLGNESVAYVGILPFLFFLAAVFTARSGVYLAFLAATIAALWFSFSGVFTALTYFFPGMTYYRHVGYIFGIYKILVVCCAGFGLERFWDLCARGKTKVLIGIPLLTLFLADGLGISYSGMVKFIDPAFFRELWQGEVFTRDYFRIFVHLVTLGVLLLGIFLYTKKRPADEGLARRLELVLLCCFALDVFSYQAYLAARKPGEDHKAFVDAGRVHRTAYQDERHNEPRNPFQERTVALMDLGVTKYDSVYDMAQFAPCVPQFRAHITPKSVAELEKEKENIPSDQFALITGCGSPKLRLVSAPELLRGSPVEGQVSVRAFTTDSLEAEVVAASATSNLWLVYSDTFHPGWKASVNGRPGPVAVGNMAFKAVQLGPGQSTVRFTFDHFPSRSASWLIALFGLGYGYYLLWMLGVAAAGRETEGR